MPVPVWNEPLLSAVVVAAANPARRSGEDTSTSAVVVTPQTSPGDLGQHSAIPSSFVPQTSAPRIWADIRCPAVVVAAADVGPEIWGRHFDLPRSLWLPQTSSVDVGSAAVHVDVDAVDEVGERAGQVGDRVATSRVDRSRTVWPVL